MELFKIPCKGNYDFLLNRENGKWLIARSNSNVNLNSLKKRENHRFGGLDVIILNTTTKCNLSCGYCLVGDRKKESLNFDWDVGEELIKKCKEQPQKNIVIVYHGSEPLMNFDFVKEFTRYGKKELTGTEKNISFSLQTNATKLNKEILEFLIEEDMGISFSLDGFKQHNDLTRLYPSGHSTYKDVIKGVNLLKKCGKITFPITVISKYNIKDLPEIVEGVKKQGFPYIQLTPVEPLGSAVTEDLSPDPDLLSEKLIKIYEENFQSALRGEKFKVRNLVNILATFFVPTLPDVCSTCGINKLQVLGVDVNGDLYPCDMWFGRKDYSVGNIRNLSIKDALDSDKNFRNYRKANLIKGGDSFPFMRLHTGGCPANAYGQAEDIFTPSIYARTHEKVYTYLASQMPFLIKNKLIDFFLGNDNTK